MRTGHDLLMTHRVDVDFMRKVVSLLKVLMETAMETAVQFANACGRDLAGAHDVRLALKYEAHEFFHRDFDAAFFAHLASEQHHTYEEDSEGESEASEDASEKASEDASEEVSAEASEEAWSSAPSTEFIRGDRAFHAKVLQYARDWDQWTPDDPIQAMMKRAIDARVE